jgi:spermidine synthase
LRLEELTAETQQFLNQERTTSCELKQKLRFTHLPKFIMTARPRERKDFAWVILACFLLSGTSGLVYQVIWVRQLELVFGTTAFATSTVLTAFMAGLALGSYLFGRRAHRTSQPLRLYGLLELGIGLYGLAIPRIFTWLPGIYEPIWLRLHLSFVLLTLIRFVIAILVLIVPTVFMGATLPVLANYYADGTRSIGLRVGQLYSVNTFGAVMGAAAGGFVLIPTLGMRSTSYIAASINLILAAAALAISRFVQQRSLAGEHVPDDQVPVDPVRVDSLPDLPSAAARGNTRSSRRARMFQSNSRARQPGGRLTRLQTYLKAGEDAPPDRRAILAVLAAFSLSGFVALSYEVIWSRVLALIIGSSVYAFSIMLSTFLVGLAVGSAVGSRLVDRLRRPLAVFALIELGVGCTSLIGAYLFDQLPFVFVSLYRWLAASNIAILLFARFIVTSLVMIAPTILLGALFPLVVRIVYGGASSTAAGARQTDTARTVGNVYAINTLGAIGGAFASGFVLIPYLGMLGSLRLSVAANFFLALIVFLASCGAGPLKTRPVRVPKSAAAPRRAGAMSWAGILASALLIVFTAAVAPPWDVAVMSSGVYRYAPQVAKASHQEFFDYFSERGQGETAFYKEGVSATVVVQRKGNDRVLKVNGKPDASTAGDLPTQVLIGSMPLLLRPKSEDCLVIGLGSGVTLGSVEQFPLKQVTCVELEPAVIEASHYFDDVNHRPLEDPRLRLIANDGRNFIDTTDQKFDVIVSEPSNPWLTGAASLFTLEYFKRGASRLKDDGLFSQFVQIYEMAPQDVASLIATFRAAFPNAYLFRGAEGDLMLLGSKQELKIDLATIRSHLADSRIAADLERIKTITAADFVSRFYMGPRELATFSAGAELNTDDNALIEFRAPRRVGIDEDTVNNNVRELLAHTASPLPYISGDYFDDPPASPLKVSEPPEPGGPDSFLLDAALGAIKRDDFGRAEQFVSYSLSLKDSAKAHGIIGEIRSARGDDDGALAEWLQALDIDQRDFYTLVDLGKHYLKNQEISRAVPFLDRALQVDSGSARAHHLRGLAYQAMGDNSRAAEQYRVALSDASYCKSIANFYLNYGTALAAVGLYDDAAQMLEQHLKLNPADTEAQYQLGSAYEILAERATDQAYDRYTDQAVEHLARVVSARPGHAMAHYYLSKAYRRRGLLELADQEYELYERYLPR